ncbi:hypothetical protein TrRE_jg10585, partial [Triparma retinervis]
ADGKSPTNPISLALNSIKDALVGLLTTEGGTAQTELQPNTAPFLLDKFSTHCITYLSNYITHVSALRVAFDKIDLLRRENDHYQKKVDELHGKFLKKQQKASGASIPEDGKLVRNRRKLAQALLTYTAASDNLVRAVDLLVDTGWKEVHGIALKIMQFERMYSGPFGSRVVTAARPLEGILEEAGKEHTVRYDPNFIRIDEIFEVVSRSFLEKEGEQGVPVQTTAAAGGERDRAFSAGSERGSEDFVAAGEGKKSKKRWSMFGGGKKKDSAALEGDAGGKVSDSVAGPTTGSTVSIGAVGGAPPVTPVWAGAKSGLAPPTGQPSWAKGGDTSRTTAAAGLKPAAPAPAPTSEEPAFPSASVFQVQAPQVPLPATPAPQAPPGRQSSDFASATTPWADFNSKGGALDGGGSDVAFGNFDNFTSPPPQSSLFQDPASGASAPLQTRASHLAPQGVTSPVVSPPLVETGGFANFSAFGDLSVGDRDSSGSGGPGTAVSAPPVNPNAAGEGGTYLTYPL